MKYVIVTGASGGIGRSVCLDLAKNGYYVFALDKYLQEDVENILQIEVDLKNADEIEKAYNIVKEITNEIEAIIHFAGVYVLDSLVEIDEKKFDDTLKVNFYSPYLVNKRFIDMMKKGSKIIITTSELAKVDPLPFTSLYAITKIALDKYAYSLRMELALLDISVISIRAGAVNTKMLDKSEEELERFSNNTTHYQLNAKNFKNIVTKVEAKKIESSKLSKLVLKIMNKKNPKFAYNINNSFLLKCLNILPMSLRFKIIKKILK